MFRPVFNRILSEVGFHTPRLAGALDLAEEWAALPGPRSRTGPLRRAQSSSTPSTGLPKSSGLHEAGARWIVDLGPGDVATRVTAPVIRGLGIGIVPAATRAGTAACSPPAPSRGRPAVVELRADAWSTLPDGSVEAVDQVHPVHRRSPILLAGMTPTTVDAKIVAAAANAGHWAELAGGGQVTEQIFDDRIAELTTLLEPGRAVQFNSLFLDPYLWKLQLGGKRLVQKARQAGAPIDGVVRHRRHPRPRRGRRADRGAQRASASATWCSSRAPSSRSRRSSRSPPRCPTKPVIVHIEGGRAGGHHSWEDLDDLLLATYSDLRGALQHHRLRRRRHRHARAGGRVPVRRWAAGYGFPHMPVDGILVGTAAMATLEATTSPSGQAAARRHHGHRSLGRRRKAQGGMASGRSQLGADIHEIDNAASRCGRLLDEVAGDADAVAERRDEIIAAMADTAKPYFGDVDDMTYLQWLQRYVELAIGDGDSHRRHRRRRLAVARHHLARPLRRDAAARRGPAAPAGLRPDRDPVRRRRGRRSAAGGPGRGHRGAAGAVTPTPATVTLHPADVPFFVTLCKTLGKPVNFVPVIDKDVRRWWRSDSLWQAHDARYPADQVCIIPGTAAVAGITRVDEPVGDLLDRFEQAAIDERRGLGRHAEPPHVMSRRHGRTDVTGPLAVVLDAPDVLWAGRTATNPVHRIAPPSDWQVHQPAGKRPRHKPFHRRPARGHRRAGAC